MTRYSVCTPVQLSGAFRQMDADGDGRVNATDVDIFFAANGIADAPSGEAEVKHTAPCLMSLLRAFTLRTAL